MVIKLLEMLSLVVVFVPASIGLARAAEPATGVQDVAKEIRSQIKDIHEALGEITPKDKNTAEVCFRIGAIYQTTRHELAEVSARQKDFPAPAKPLVEALIKDAKSLPSFCRDKEKVKQDPGYEQVPLGDVADLKRELKNMDDRAARLAALP